MTTERSLGKKFDSLDDAYYSLVKDEESKYDGGEFTKNTNFRRVYGNRNTPLQVGLYDISIYPGFWNAMLYEVGVIAMRKDGSLARKFENRWRNSAHVWPSLRGIEEVVTEENRFKAQKVYSDESKEIVDLGSVSIPKAYMIFRENDSYNSFINSLEDKLLNRADLEINCYITNKGAEIIETDYVKNIPENAIVITDAAAIKKCSSLKNKKIIRIDELIRESFGKNPDFGLKLKATGFDEDPFKITIFKPSCADHPEPESELGLGGAKCENDYIEFLKKQFLATYSINENNIFVTSNPKDLHYEQDIRFINVIDRHASLQFSKNGIYNKSLKLPLYENFVSSTGNPNNNLLKVFNPMIEKILNKIIDKID